MKLNFIRPLFLTLAVATTAPIAAIAQSPEGLSRDAQAQMLGKLWVDTCAKHFPNPEALRSAAKSFNFQQDPPYAAELLAGKGGTVWDASIGNFAQFSVVLLNDGSCKVLARRASSGPVVAVFEKVLQDIRTPGVSVERVVDREVGQSGQKFRQIAYFLSRTGADNGWAFVATVSESENVPIQATISTSRSQKP
jgi:hypothetical protein